MLRSLLLLCCLPLCALLGASSSRADEPAPVAVPVAAPIAPAEPSASSPSSSPSSSSATTIALVQKVLLTPMKARESRTSRFSRAAMPPSERRVQVSDAMIHTDAQGAHFVRYSVDQRYAFDEEGAWTAHVLSGCAYPDAGTVYVVVGDRLRPAAALTATSAADRKREAPAGVCTDGDAPRG